MSNKAQPGVQERHCAHCGEKFTTRHAAHFYCSVRCRREAGPQPPALASAYSSLAAPVASGAVGLASVPERLDRLNVEQLQALVHHTGQMLGRSIV